MPDKPTPPPTELAPTRVPIPTSVSARVPAAANQLVPTEDLPTPKAIHPGMPKIVKFNELARCGEEIWIEHAGQLYRLRRTRQDKLILTK